jgi:hypothetical protein
VKFIKKLFAIIEFVGLFILFLPCVVFFIIGYVFQILKDAFIFGMEKAK